MKIRDIVYLIPEEGLIIPRYIILDYTSDLSFDQTANVTDNPIDAVNGASMQENRVVDMVSVGISGSFSERNEGRKFLSGNQILLFPAKSNNRLETIVDWFEKAIDKKTLFTVCKKGLVYKDQLLNKIKWTFDDSASKIDVSLSFIEVEMVERAEKEGSVSIVLPTSSSGSGNRSGIRASMVFEIE